MLVYLACLVLLGLPAIVMEFAIGRASQASPVFMYRKLEKPGHKWGIFGIVCLIGNIALMAFYTVVTGWIIYYFVKFLTGQNDSFGFEAMITNPGVNVTFLLVTVVAAFGACNKVHDGITLDFNDGTCYSWSDTFRSKGRLKVLFGS